MKIINRLWPLAIKSLLRRKMRTFLTSLGIIIGTATIATIVGIGVAAQQDIAKQYSNLSATTIFINPASESNSSTGTPSKTSVEDKPLILQGTTLIASAVPQVTARSVISYTTASESATVIGTTADFQQSLQLEMLQGTFYTEADEELRSKKIVLGYNLAELLFTDPNKAVGESILIERKSYEVVGVITFRGGAVGKLAIDDSAFAPFETVRRALAGSDAKVTYVLQAVDVESIPQSMADVQTILRTAHDLKPTEPDDFKIKDMGSVVSSAMASAQTMTILLASVAILVLLVGGIGIMNIMYVSVEERTREIGIRKAIGAKEKYILYQFLIEAVVLTSLAASTGIAVSFGVIYLASLVNYTIPVVTWGFALAFLSSLAIGIFFAWYPAKQGSTLNPIDALRHE